MFRRCSGRLTLVIGFFLNLYLVVYEELSQESLVLRQNLLDCRKRDLPLEINIREWCVHWTVLVDEQAAPNTLQQAPEL